jgi:hypothetical protein
MGSYSLPIISSQMVSKAFAPGIVIMGATVLPCCAYSRLRQQTPYSFSASWFSTQQRVCVCVCVFCQDVGVALSVVFRRFGCWTCCINRAHEAAAFGGGGYTQTLLPTTRVALPSRI